MLEALRRLHGRSPHAFNELLALANGRGHPLTVAEVQARYAAALRLPADPAEPAAPAAGGQNRPWHTLHFRHRMLAAIQPHLRVLCGDEAPHLLLSSRYRFDLLAPEVIAVGSSDSSVTFVDGFMVVPPRRVRRRLAPQRLEPRIAYESTFFRHYWLLVEEGEGNEQDYLEVLLHRLDLGNIGIAVVSVSGDVTPYLSPRCPAPVPDRRAIMLRDVLRQGERPDPVLDPKTAEQHS